MVHSSNPQNKVPGTSQMVINTRAHSGVKSARAIFKKLDEEKFHEKLRNKFNYFEKEFNEKIELIRKPAKPLR